jgi:hypothetical protein
LKDNRGLLYSSSKYKAFIEGTPIKIKIIMGITVQTISIKFSLVSNFIIKDHLIVLIIKYITILKIIIMKDIK